MDARSTLPIADVVVRSAFQLFTIKLNDGDTCCCLFAS